MQATSSRVPTAKPHDPIQKQIYDVWTGPGPLVKFVRCLRLLDLDLLEDWPEISDQSFSTFPAKQNLQERIKLTEWSLYRLFELWSPSETRDKLRPFFPPLTPLQSLNLRAALYRTLDRLKKDGILGKEILLRKRMLDECKGEKFEELISAFAMTVLRKVAQAKNDAQLELPCSDCLTGRQEARLLPLIIAHRRSLQQKVSQHRKTQEHAEFYSGNLAQRHALIEERRVQLSKLLVLKEEQKTGICEEIADSFLGDDRWIDILMSGPARSTDPFLEAPFEIGWKAVLDGRTVDVEHRTDLLEELNGMIAKQEARLRKWKTFAASLRNTEARRQDALPEPASFETYNSAVLQFERHEMLRLSDLCQPTRVLDTYVTANSTHKNLLASMEADLASLGWRNIRKPSTARREPGNEPRTFSKNEKNGGQRLRDPHQLQNVFKTSLDLPTVMSASHGSEESSTLGQSRRKTTPPRPTKSTSIALQQVESKQPGTSAPMHLWTPTDFSPIARDIMSRESCVLVHSAIQPILSTHQQSVRIETTPHEAPSCQIDPDKHQRKQSSFTSINDISSIVHTKRNTHDSEEQTMLFMPENVVIQSKWESRGTVIEQDSVQTTVSPTLLERTRQSMLLLPKPAEKARLKSSDQQKSSKQMRLSKAFPTNQFEASHQIKLSNPSQTETFTPRSVLSTPRDELLSDTEAYDSVFKSRPRIALSPILSPDKNRPGLDNMLEEEQAYLLLDGDS